MTLNFYISYLVPVSPERMQEIEKEISRVELTIANSLSDPSWDRSDADLALARLRAQMEPMRRREPAVMRSYHDGKWTAWDCPRCARDGKTYSIAVIDGGNVNVPVAECPGCGAEVHKEELPMSLDLYRMRTRRNDGVEVQAK